MKKKTYIILVVLLFVIGIFTGGLIGDNTVSSEVSNMEQAFYVEDRNNLFVVVAKALENSCYCVVNFIFEGIKNILGSIFGI